MSRKRSAAFEAAANHWAKKAKPVEGDKQDSVKQPENHDKGKASPIKLLYNPSYDDDVEDKVNIDTIKISTLLGASNISQAFHFNFNIELDFVLSLFNPNMIVNKVPITFITGADILNNLNYDEETRHIISKFNLSQVIASLPNKFGTHHTKMMINFFDNNQVVEIVIMTSNYTKLDFGGLTQMLWKSEKLPKGETNTVKGKRFKFDLLNYLKKYNKPRINKLVELLHDFNFLSVNVELLASAPGIYDISHLTHDSETYGYGKLYQILKRNELLNNDPNKTTNFLAQVTSISYPFNISASQTSSIFSHLLCPLVFSAHQPFQILPPGMRSSKNHQKLHNYKPHIVFPTVREIAASNCGFTTGQAVHFNYTKTHNHENQYEQNIKPYLYKWNSSPSQSIISGRETVTAHVKLFLCDNDDEWKTLKWVLMGSHNLSKQAWGSPKGSKYTSGNPNVYEIASYELGVVIVPEEDEKLIPTYGTDKCDESKSVAIRLPFVLPPEKYGIDDKPWSPHLNYDESIMDKFGNNYIFN